MKTPNCNISRKSFLLFSALTLTTMIYAVPTMADGSNRQSQRYGYRGDHRGDQSRIENRRNNKTNRRANVPRYDNRGTGDYYEYGNPAPGYYGRDDHNGSYNDDYNSGPYYDSDPYYDEPYDNDAPYYDGAGDRDDYYENGNVGGILGEILGGVFGGGAPRNGIPRGGSGQNDIIGAVLGGVLRR